MPIAISHLCLLDIMWYHGAGGKKKNKGALRFVSSEN